MFSIMTEENGEHLKKLPHLCPILCPIREFPQGFPEKRRKRYFDGRVQKNALKERVFEFCVDSLLRRNIIVLRGE